MLIAILNALRIVLLQVFMVISLTVFELDTYGLMSYPLALPFSVSVVQIELIKK